MATSMRTPAERQAPARSIRPRARAEDIQAPKGTVLVTFLYLLAIAAMWGFMYLTLLRSA
ncbi:hypothetical protein DYI95_001115 [Thermaerobacter sp. PB12/4term]|uniref:hypothetical protein n=1 Tax=Thermaerobacter sp. PB12/4term TaxID=2293838 RepID=UPI000E32A142|nr:hypothetical protein [Thermaerobacter sp. PB12/4term]QIA26316.1 hypothetical protein DYI95_001115 [Thermaerobacter sp. PB12/4term]